MQISKAFFLILLPVFLVGCSSDESVYPSLYQIPQISSDLQGQNTVFDQKENQLEDLKQEMTREKDLLLDKQQQEGLGLSIREAL